MKKLQYILIILVLFAAQQVIAQQHTSKAYSLYQTKEYDSAQFWIDSAIVTSEKNNSQTWQLRGLIYRNLESEKNPNYRKIAINSFLEAKKIDLDHSHEEKINGYLYNTIIRYYNDAVTSMNKSLLETSEKQYNLYKELYIEHIDPSSVFIEKDIEFYNALAGACLKLVNSSEGEEKVKNTSMCVNFFEVVLKLNPDQFQPNFNVGIMYYNQGADLIMNMDPLTPIENIPLIESQAQNSFKKALPYLLKANKMQPDRLDVIEGITGCYYGLQDDVNYEMYQKTLDEKNLPNLLEKHQNNPKNREVVRELVRIYSTTIKDDEMYKKYASILNNLEE